MATREEIAKLYVATFNRAADADGLAYWISDGTDATTSLTDLEDLAAAMTESPEYQALYDGMDRQAIVTAMYQNLFDRAPDNDGLEYWSGVDVDGDGTVYGDGAGATVPVNELIIALINGAQDTDVTIMDNKAEVGLAYADAGLNDVEKAKEVMEVVTADPASVETAKATIETLVEEAALSAMNQLPLTTDDDSLVGTAGDDFFDATTLNTLGDDDVIIDSTTTDNDILKASVTSNDVAALIQNVETIEVTGEYVTTGLALTSVTNAKELKLDTKLAGGTATVSDANSINAEKIVAGSNISKLNVESLTSGTRDTVAVDGGSADVTLKGAAGGSDTYDVTLASGKTLTLDTLASAGDAVSVNASGDFTLTNATDNSAELALTITNNSADAITVTDGDATLMAKTLTLAGNDIVLDVTTNTAAVNGLEVTSSAASSTIKLSLGAAGATIANTDLSKAVVTTVDVAADMTANNLIVNEGTVVNLTETQSGAGTIGIQNVDGDLTTGTLLLNVSEDQTAVTTDTTVDTLLIKATPDEATDTLDSDGNTQEIDVAGLTLSTKTTTVVVTGSEDLKIGTLTGNSGGALANGDADVVTATGMTGDLTIATFTQDAKVYLGSGDDSIIANVNQAFEIYAGAGDDSIDLNTGTAAAASTVNAEAGDDKVTTSGNGDTVDLGTGDDTVTLNGAATVTLGDGADTVKADVANAATIKDFTTGTDVIELSGTLSNDFDVTDLSQTDSKYDLDGDGNDDDLTLTGVTAANLSDSIALDVTVDAAKTIVAGSLDDTIVNTTAAATITTGAGEDEVEVKIAGTTVKDFTTGSDKIVYAVAAAGNIDLTEVTPTDGAYDIDGGGADFTLTDHTETDLTSMVELDIDASGGTYSVTGGTFDDTINVGNGNTVNFIDNGGMDTITSFATGSDKLSFDAMTEIDATEGSDLTAATAKVSDASDGSVYVLDGTNAVDGDTIDFSVIGTEVNNATIKYTSDVFVDDVAAYINTLLGTSTGENYVVAITGGDADNADGDADATTATDTLLYYVSGNDAGITADDLTLIGFVADATVAAGDIA